MKRTVYTIGETVYDIIFHHGQIQAGRVGGSMLNSSVSLGRLGYNSCFVSEVGNDDLGELVIDFLERNKVNARFIDRFNEGKTPVALAFLDDQKNARYTFLKDYPSIRLQQHLPQVTENDIVMFGSFFSISPAVRATVLRFLKQAGEAGALVIYDPNIRKPRKNEIPELLPMIFENFALADIVRASHEDFQTIFGTDEADEASRIVKVYSDAALIFTRGSNGIKLFAGDCIREYSVPAIEVLSTIGAGDTFNAGIAKSLIDQSILKRGLSEISPNQWDQLIQTGISLSQEVCLSYDNYVSERESATNTI
ncbi:MAG: carbohydrate kinase [Bacteroidales bacterium]|nr:carbohydrate kinase [Bacteroidales bacterium]